MVKNLNAHVDGDSNVPTWWSGIVGMKMDTMEMYFDDDGEMWKWDSWVIWDVDKTQMFKLLLFIYLKCLPLCVSLIMIMVTFPTKSNSTLLYSSPSHPHV